MTPKELYDWAVDNDWEACDLNYVPNQMVEKEVRAAISNSLGFGGHNATILIKKYTD